LVGGLDERYYPVYFVDADLAMAMRKVGFAVLYQPNSRIRHHLGASTNPDFKAFLQQRNRRLFVEKWGAALENHEPYERDSSAAIEHALARAEIFAVRCRLRDDMVIEHSGQPKPFDAVEQHSRHVEKSRALQEAYAAYQARCRRRAFARNVACSLMGKKLYEQARGILAHIHPRGF
jgi:hypothetical protein